MAGCGSEALCLVARGINMTSYIKAISLNTSLEIIQAVRLLVINSSLSKYDRRQITFIVTRRPLRQRP